MKAHIHTDPRALLLWRFDDTCAGYEAVEQAARVFRLTVRQLSEKDLTATVGSLCGMRGLSPTDTTEEGATAVPYALSAMIVCGLSHENGDLNALITQVNGSGANLPLKAMVTDTSKGWRLAHLLGELTAERQALAESQPTDARASDDGERE